MKIHKSRVNAYALNDGRPVVFDIYGLSLEGMYLLQRIPFEDVSLDEDGMFCFTEAPYINFQAELYIAMYVHEPESGIMVEINRYFYERDEDEPWLPQAGLKRGIIYDK